MNKTNFKNSLVYILVKKIIDKNIIKKSIYLIIILLSFSCLDKLYQKKYNFNKDEDVISFILEADKQLLRVVFIQNSEYIQKSYKLKPIKSIKSKEELTSILNKYWSDKYIEYIWKEGSKGMPKAAFGFYTESDFGYLNARSIKIMHKEDNVIIVRGEIPDIFTDNYRYRDLYLIKKNNVWKIDKVRYDDIKE